MFEDDTFSNLLVALTLRMKKKIRIVSFIILLKTMFRLLGLKRYLNQDLQHSSSGSGPDIPGGTVAPRVGEGWGHFQGILNYPQLSAFIVMEAQQAFCQIDVFFHVEPK